MRDSNYYLYFGGNSDPSSYWLLIEEVPRYQETPELKLVS